MHSTDGTLQVGDHVELLPGTILPPHCRIAVGTRGQVLFIDDQEPAAVTVQFNRLGRPLRLRRIELRRVRGAAQPD